MGDVEVQGRSGRLDGLLRELRRQMARGGAADVREILEWLRRQTGAQLALVAEGAGAVEASTSGFPGEVLRTLAPLLGRLSGGQLGAAAAEAGAWQVRCEALGAHGPRPVLVVADRAALSAEAVALASHTGSVLTLLRQARDADRMSRGYQYKARQLRFAVLSALMIGDPTLARRMTTGAVPPLLEAGLVRVHLLHCPPADRDWIAQVHQDPSGYHGQDLMVHCPVFKSHLICLITDDEAIAADAAHPTNPATPASTRNLPRTATPTPTPDANPTPHPLPDRGDYLRKLVTGNPRYALGISGPHPLSSIAEAYDEATHALAAARTTLGRVVLYHGHTPLDGLLPRAAALAWARALLRPLESVPKVAVDITRLLMSMPRSAVARLLDLSRNTVTAHIRRVEGAIGLDLSDVRCRAAVHLALALISSCAEPEPAERQLPPVLDDLLRTERAAVWARAFLDALEATHLRTLRAWIDANTDAQQAAARIGINRNTVRAHLRAAEALLGRDLLTTGSGVHDVVHALRITDAVSPTP